MQYDRESSEIDKAFIYCGAKEFHLIMKGSCHLDTKTVTNCHYKTAKPRKKCIPSLFLFRYIEHVLKLKTERLNCFRNDTALQENCSHWNTVQNDFQISLLHWTTQSRIIQRAKSVSGPNESHATSLAASFFHCWESWHLKTKRYLTTILCRAQTWDCWDLLVTSLTVWRLQIEKMCIVTLYWEL